MSLQYIRVHDAYLQPDSGSPIPVAQFSLTFQLDALPVANIVPAFGKNLSTGVRWSIADLPVDEEMSLVLVIDGTPIEMLRGYVRQTTAQTSSQFLTANAANNIVLAHRACKLAGSPFSTLSYVSQLKSPVVTRYNQYHMGLFGNGKGKAAAAPLMMARALYDNNYLRAARWPASVIRDMALKVIKENYGGSDYAPGIEDWLVAYDPANFGSYYFDASRLYQAMYTAFARSVPGSNLWTGIQQTAAQMFLRIVPSASKIHIGNPLSIRNAVDVTVTSSEYAGFSASPRDISMDPVDHIIVRTFAKGPNERQAGNFVSTYYAYPPFKNSDGEIISDLKEAAIVPDGVFCHWRDAPYWITKETAQGSRLANSAEFPNARKVKGRIIVDDEARNAGEKLAQLYYAVTKGKRFMSPKLLLPFRTDIMPGTMMHIDGIDSDIIGADGLYGMVNRVTFTCSNMGNSTLQMEVSMEDARTEEDQRTFEDGGLTISDAGLFEQNWVGIGINGEPVGDGLPSHTAFPVSPAPSASDKSGALSGTAG